MLSNFWIMRIKEFQTLKSSCFVQIPFSTFWSYDNYVATATDKGVHIMGGVFNKVMVTSLLTLLVLTFSGSCLATDITQNIFGTDTDFVPAAFGDFNSDEYIDLFVIRNDHKTIEVLLGSESDPVLLHKHVLKCSFSESEYITSVIPGDFDGDALLDIVLTVLVPGTQGKPAINSVRVLWGQLTSLNCSGMEKELFRLHGQPLAIDYNSDMIMDLFGENLNHSRTIWLFNQSRENPIPDETILNTFNRHFSRLRYPHSHAFLDLNRDSSADLYLTTEDNYEIWLYNKETKKFNFAPDRAISFPSAGDIGKKVIVVGQTIFMDIELDGKIDHVVPVCFTGTCSESAIFVYSGNKWHNLKVSFQDVSNAIWGFVPPEKNEICYFKSSITLHSGDFNMDGYPDLLATLKCGNNFGSFMLENIPCPGDKCDFSRTFRVLWSALSPFNNGTVLGVFVDFTQNGILDILFVHQGSGNKLPFVSAFKNNLDYDANFLKVMVLTGLTNKYYPSVPTPLQRTRNIYGTSYPGPLIWYKTTTQEGLKREAVAPQLPQSAYFSLHLPYTLFGLGRAPNFIDSLDVGVSGSNKTWNQIIPNSQMVVVSFPPSTPNKWFAQLFVTPSKIILKTALALCATCGLISLIIFILWWKEKREDHQEKLQEAHRFHFDAL